MSINSLLPRASYQLVARFASHKSPEVYLRLQFCRILLHKKRGESVVWSTNAEDGGLVYMLVLHVENRVRLNLGNDLSTFGCCKQGLCSVTS